MIVLGALVLVLGVLALAVGLAFSLALWETWWLHPLWAVVVAPLGFGLITFWHLFALNVFISVLFFAPAAMDYAKEEDKTTRTVSQVSRLFVAFVRPVTAYYVIRFVLGVQE